jgi:hypothetical protein
VKFKLIKQLSYLLLVGGVLVQSFSISGVHYSIAQTQELSSPITIFLNSEQDNNTTLVGRKVNVLYESAQTVILRAQAPWWDVAGHAIDFAKEKGFNIDSVTVFTKQSNGTTFFVPDLYTIFMSKN